MSPKLINGSFAALFDDNEAMEEVAKQISADNAEHLIPLSPRRRKLRDQSKQQSLDQTTLTERCLMNSYKHQGSLDSKLDEIINSSSYLETRMNGMQMDDVFEAEEDHPCKDAKHRYYPQDLNNDIFYSEEGTQTETDKNGIGSHPTEEQSILQRKNPNIRLQIPEVSDKVMRSICPHCGNMVSM